MTFLERLQIPIYNTENRVTIHLPKPGGRTEEKGQESVQNNCIPLKK